MNKIISLFSALFVFSAISAPFVDNAAFAKSSVHIHHNKKHHHKGHKHHHKGHKKGHKRNHKQ